LRALLLEAGCRHVEIEQASMTARFPNPEGFLAGEIDVDTAAIPSMRHLHTQARKAVTESLREDMEAPLKAVTNVSDTPVGFGDNLVSDTKSGSPDHEKAGELPGPTGRGRAGRSTL